jgi:hypothetical protein
MKLKRAHWIGAATIVGAALLVAACASELNGPSNAGQLTVEMSTAGGGGAAFKVMLIGESITNPVAASAGDLVYSFASNDTVKLAVIGDHASGPLVKFSVPNVDRVSSYRAVLLEVAGSDNALLSTSDFTLTATQ